MKEALNKSLFLELHAGKLLADVILSRRSFDKDCSFGWIKDVSKDDLFVPLLKTWVACCLFQRLSCVINSLGWQVVPELGKDPSDERCCLQQCASVHCPKGWRPDLVWGPALVNIQSGRGGRSATKPRSKRPTSAAPKTFAVFPPVLFTPVMQTFLGADTVVSCAFVTRGQRLSKAGMSNVGDKVFGCLPCRSITWEACGSLKSSCLIVLRKNRCTVLPTNVLQAPNLPYDNERCGRQRPCGTKGSRRR